MTADDFRALEAFLYGGELGRAEDDMRLSGRSVRAYRSGRTALPPTVAAYLVGRVALRLTLNGWSADFPSVSAEIRAEIHDRLEEARRHAEQADPHR